SFAAARAAHEIWKQSKIHVHWLECLGNCRAADVAQQCAKRSGRRRRSDMSSEHLGRGKATREQSHCGALHVTFDAGDLSCKTQVGTQLQSQLRIEQLRRVEKRVAMETAQPRELRLPKAGDHPKNSNLLGMLQLGLES